MPRTPTRLTPKEVRKQLLLAESEVNRATLSREFHAFQVEAHEITHRIHSVWSKVSSFAAMSLAGLGAFRDLRASRRYGRASWLQNLFQGARVGASIWSAFRARRRNEERTTPG